MSPYDILRSLRRRPFQPLRVFLSDGSHHDVRHPEMVFVTRRSVSIAIEPIRNQVPDDYVLCDPLHITRIEPLASDGARR